jgi:sulfoxide reductase heme-binding subunit YedZ
VERHDEQFDSRLMSSTLLWYTTRASGVVTLVLLTLTMVLGLATTRRYRRRGWPRFAQQELHRRISMMAVVLLCVHVITSVLDTYVHIGWFAVVVPFTSSYSRFWVGLGAIALDLLGAVLVSSLLRSHINAATWRAIHWLAYLSWPVAMAHAFGTGTDARNTWMIVLGVLCAFSVGLALLWRVADTAKPEVAQKPTPPPVVPRTRVTAAAGARGDLYGDR